MNIEIGDSVRLRLSRNAINDQKSDLLANLQDRYISGKTFDAFTSALETPDRVWIVQRKNDPENDPDVFEVGLTKKGKHSIVVDLSEMEKA